jgi:hypothetical protein
MITLKVPGPIAHYRSWLKEPDVRSVILLCGHAGICASQQKGEKPIHEGIPSELNVFQGNRKVW